MLSAGVESSEGIVILDGTQAYYVASSAQDLSTTLEQIIGALDDIASTFTTISTTLTSIGGGMTGPTTAPPPTLPTDVLSITAKVTEIQAAKTALENLQGALT